MKLFKISLFALTLLLLSGCEISGAISAYYAKEYCSCHFVMKQSDDYCHDHASQIIPISKKKIDEELQSVWARALGKENTAIYAGEREGCVLTTGEGL